MFCIDKWVISIKFVISLRQVIQIKKVIIIFILFIDDNKKINIKKIVLAYIYDLNLILLI